MANGSDGYITIRLDEKLKKDFEAFCESCEMTISGAVKLFATKVVREGKIPFDVVMTGNTGKKSEDDALGMKTTRINVRIDKALREEFAKVCEEQLGKSSMSRIVKMFMVNCINNGRVTF